LVTVAVNVIGLPAQTVEGLAAKLVMTGTTEMDGASVLVSRISAIEIAPAVDRSLPETDPPAPTAMAPEATIVPRKMDPAPKAAAPVT